MARATAIEIDAIYAAFDQPTNAAAIRRESDGRGELSRL
jgi:hypothetical protein